MLVRISKDWTYPDLKRQTPDGDGVWDGVTFTEQPVAACDLLIVLNSPATDIRVRCPAGNRWLFTQESPIEKYRWHTDSFKHFDRVFTFWDDSVSNNIVHTQTSLPWHVDRSYAELSAMSHADCLPLKSRRLSWVTSNASHKGGHQLRMGLKDFLLSAGFAFDLYGRGFEPIADKFDGLLPYRYSLAIENHSCDDYWTEKLADCLLAWTMPIYWGAKNILKYFPERSMVLIDPADPPAALHKIRSAIDNDDFSRSVDARAEARDLVLNRYQLFPHVAHLMSRYRAPSTARKVSALIPANPFHYRGESDVARAKRLLKRALHLG